MIKIMISLDVKPYSVLRHQTAHTKQSQYCCENLSFHILTFPYTDELWRGEPLQMHHTKIVLNHETQAAKLPDLAAIEQFPFSWYLLTNAYSATSQKT
jgi:hypothetical protein